MTCPNGNDQMPLPFAEIKFHSRQKESRLGGQKKSRRYAHRQLVRTLDKLATMLTKLHNAIHFLCRSKGAIAQAHNEQYHKQGEHKEKGVMMLQR